MAYLRCFADEVEAQLAFFINLKAGRYRPVSWRADNGPLKIYKECLLGDSTWTEHKFVSCPCPEKACGLSWGNFIYILRR